MSHSSGLGQSHSSLNDAMAGVGTAAARNRNAQERAAARKSGGDANIGRKATIALGHVCTKRGGAAEEAW